MGIRCECPRGHQLNVKAFLAGKKGICPHCGERFRIPQPDAQEPAAGPRADELDVGDPESAEEPEAPRAGKRHSAPSPAASQRAPRLRTEAQPALEISRAAERAARHPDMPMEASSPEPHAAAPLEFKKPEPSAPEHADLFQEMPQATWYLRTPAGDQFGPATASEMRKWRAEGRISPDSYVWREDWPDWRLAGQVLNEEASSAAPVPRIPALSAGSREPAAAVPVAAPGPLVQPVPEGKPQLRAVEVRAARGRQRRSTYYLVVLLVLLCLALFAALIYVLVW